LRETHATFTEVDVFPKKLAGLVAMLLNLGASRAEQYIVIT